MQKRSHQLIDACMNVCPSFNDLLHSAGAMRKIIESRYMHLPMCITI